MKKVINMHHHHSNCTC